MDSPARVYLVHRLVCNSGPHPEEPCVARHLEGWTQALTHSILRDASLRDAPQDEVSYFFHAVVSIIEIDVLVEHYGAVAVLDDVVAVDTVAILVETVGAL